MSELKTVDLGLTLDKVQQNPKQYIDQFNAEADWSIFDSYVATINDFNQNTNGTKLIPIVELGEGTVQALPTFNLPAAVRKHCGNDASCVLQYDTFGRHWREGAMDAALAALGEPLPLQSDRERRRAQLVLENFVSLFFRADLKAPPPAPSFDVQLALGQAESIYTFDPSIVGTECYLAYMYVYVQATLQRYGR